MTDKPQIKFKPKGKLKGKVDKNGQIKNGQSHNGSNGHAHATNGSGFSGSNEGKKDSGRERSLANLKMWKPGDSGNPSGRPKKLWDFQAMCQEASPEAFSKIVELMRSDDDRVAFMAAKEICDRAWGKPKTLETEAETGKVTINIVRLAPEEEPQERKVTGPMITLNRFADA